MDARTPLDSLSYEEADQVRALLEQHPTNAKIAARILGVSEVTALRLAIRGRKLHALSVAMVRERLARLAERS